MTIERAPRPIRLPLGVNVQRDPRDLAPVGAFGIKHAEICDEMLFVVSSERRIVGRKIGDVGSRGGFHIKRHSRLNLRSRHHC
jgi:hypothetical protein